jgi:hypothetical protein
MCACVLYNYCGVVFLILTTTSTTIHRNTKGVSSCLLLAILRVKLSLRKSYVEFVLERNTKLSAMTIFYFPHSVHSVTVNLHFRFKKRKGFSTLLLL